MYVIGALAFVGFVVAAFVAYVLVCIKMLRHYFEIARAKRSRLRAAAIYIFALALAGYPLMTVFILPLLEVIKILAAVASVSAADKSTMLSAGIAEAINSIAYYFLTSLFAGAVFWGLLRLLSLKRKSPRVESA